MKPGDGSAAFIKSLAEVTKKRVLVGFPSDGGTHKGGSISNAALGYILETGAPERNLPPRPFLVPGVASAKEGVSEVYKKAIVAALEHKPNAMEVAHDRAGLLAVNKVRATMTAGVSPELSPATLERRRARGRTGTVPLIDTGQLRNAVTYIVKGNGNGR